MKSDNEDISFSIEDTDFEFHDPAKYVEWIHGVAASEGSKVGQLTYIFCSDEYILQVNKEYLQHDYYTDIITFPYRQGPVIEADIFISIDRIKDNAVQFNVDFLDELRRVMAHGVLHLMGYKDKTEEEASIMSAQEDEALAKWNPIV